jgi:Tetratricopeptide repeat
MRAVRVGPIVISLLAALPPLAAGAAGLDAALQAFKAGDYASAEQQLRAVVAGSPDDLGSRFWLARCLVEERKPAEAEAEFRQVLQAKPGSLDSLHWLGVALAAQGKAKEARTVFDQVLSQRPGDKDTLAALAKLPSGNGGRPAPRAPSPDNTRIAISADGLALDVGQVDILSPNLYDYTFSSAPTDWATGAGNVKMTNRWNCGPEWSWLGAYDPEGLAAAWTKRQFSGDITVEMYSAMKMGVGEVRRYRNPSDMNLALYGDGANCDSGYNFMFGAGQNEYSCIMKGDKVLAKTEDPIALFPFFEDAYPKDMYAFHRKWWGLKARLHGTQLEFYKDGKLILEAEDPNPIRGGRVGFWTVHNGVVVSRLKIYFTHEQVPPDPLPSDALLAQPPVTSVAQRAITVDSTTHPAAYDDFEVDTGMWKTRPEWLGVRLSLVSPGADGSGHALAITNVQSGGMFGAARMSTRPVDARMNGRLAFDYKVDPDARLNLEVVVNGGIYEIPFTAPGAIGPQAQILTEVPGVKADGRWHHAEVDLAAYLDRIYPPTEALKIEDVYFANTHDQGYIHAGFGGNHAGATLLIDNFYLGGAGGKEVSVSWRAASNVPVKGVAWSVDANRSATPAGTVTAEPTLTTTLQRSGTYYAHLRPQLADGSWGPTETRAIHVDVDPPKIAGRSPDADTTSGSPVVTVRLADEGAGLDPASVRLAVQGKEYTLDPQELVLRYEPKDELLTFDPSRAGLTLTEGQEVVAEVSAADRLGHAIAPSRWQWKYAAAKDKTPPTTPDVSCSDPYLCRDDFENDTDQWLTHGGADGAIVCRDPSTAASGKYSLRVYNYRQGGRFAAFVRRDAFDAGKYRLLSFDYNATGRLRTDFALYVNDRWQSIRFADVDNPYPRIGDIPNPQIDGKWHHAEVNLYDLLRTAQPSAASYAVRYLLVGDWGYMGQPKGRTYYVDNFEIAPVVSGSNGIGFSWKSYDTSGLAGASTALDHSPATDPGTKKTVAGETVTLKPTIDGTCWFHVRTVDRAGNWSAPGHLRVMVDKDPPTVATESPKPDERTAAAQIVFGLTDQGPAGVNPASVKLRVGDKEYDTTSPALAYSAESGKLTWDATKITGSQTAFPDGQRVEVELLGAADFAGNQAKLPPAFAWTMDYSRDDQPPQITSVRSTSHLTLVSDTFEHGIGAWHSSKNDKGGQVELDETTAASGKGSLKVTNTIKGGSMRAVAWSEVFSADRYPIVSFDYNLAPGTKFDMLVLIDDQWYAIAMTNSAESAIGSIAGAAADGNWHHATVQLAEILRGAVRQNGALDVQAIVFGDREPYNNAVGAVAHIDNFIIGRVGRAFPTFRWTAADATGVSDYSYELTQDPTVVPDEVGEGPTPSKTFRSIDPGEWFFQIRARDGAGHWGSTTTYAIIHGAARPNG